MNSELRNRRSAGIETKTVARGSLATAIGRFAFVCCASLTSLNAFAQPVLITSPATINPSDGFITPTAGGPAVPLATADITVRGTTLTVNGRHTIRNLFVESNGTVTHAASFTHDYSGGAGTDVVNGMWLNVQANPSGGNVSIDATSRIDVTGRGYGDRTGPGTPIALCSRGMGGASHGGLGGRGQNCDGVQAAYGSITEPTTLGSGGWYPNGTTFTQGGGVVRLIVGGTLIVDGRIEADGVDRTDDGATGAGGSIWIDAGTLAGTGAISANGGDANINRSGGGGGRIALYLSSDEFDGSITAHGGFGWGRGGAGTLWIKQADQPKGDLILANGSRGALTRIDHDLSATASLQIAGGADLVLDESIDAPGLVVVMEGESHLRADAPLHIGWLSMLTGSVLTHESNPAEGLRVHVVNDLYIDSSSRVDVIGRGYPAQSGPGYPGDETYLCQVFGNCCGAMHTVVASCPEGRTSEAVTYGSNIAPTTLGSGNSAGSGGGAVRLTVGAVARIDGVLDASAPILPSGWGGDWPAGGSGGSIWITASEVEGTGQIVSRGVGRSAYGPVAIYACNSTFPIENIASGSTYIDTDGMLIISEPASASFCAGPDYAFTFGVLGATSFQWTRDGVPLVDGPTGTGSVISGSETSTLTIVNATTADAGVYRATASSACGNIESQDATLGNCPAEYNCDDGVDILDFLDFIDDFAACELQPGPCGSLGNADINGDTFVDILDFLDFFDAFGSGC